jgi:hypothetical protein
LSAAATRTTLGDSGMPYSFIGAISLRFPSSLALSGEYPAAGKFNAGIESGNTAKVFNYS